MKSILMKIYHTLYGAFGPQYWWPGDGPFEVMVGAVLTQNTNWDNVKRAIDNLKTAKVLDPFALHEMSRERLAGLVRPAGYFNVKAKRLKHFIRFFVDEYSGDVLSMKKTDTEVLRRELLHVNGIGPETGDSILLYALEKPVFVIDAYTKRVLSRHGMMDYAEPYDTFQELFHGNLGRDVRLFNEYHALFVRTGKEFCKPNPRCDGCPLERLKATTV